MEKKFSPFLCFLRFPPNGKLCTSRAVVDDTQTHLDRNRMPTTRFSIWWGPRANEKSLQRRNLIKITLNLVGDFKFNTSRVRKGETCLYYCGEKKEGSPKATAGILIYSYYHKDTRKKKQNERQYSYMPMIKIQKKTFIIRFSRNVFAHSTTNNAGARTSSKEGFNRFRSEQTEAVSEHSDDI